MSMRKRMYSRILRLEDDLEVDRLIRKHNPLLLQKMKFTRPVDGRGNLTMKLLAKKYRQPTGMFLMDPSVVKGGFSSVVESKCVDVYFANVHFDSKSLETQCQICIASVQAITLLDAGRVWAVA